uniref:Tetraspanin n=1 Tax=Ciona savignyi TaxID=51511 RepID=H2ZP30_CIOSA
MWYRERDEIPRVNPVLQGILFFFNVLYWLFSCTVLGVGLYAYLEKDADLTSVTDIITNPAIGLICVGVALFCLTFFGCVGALRQNVCMLKFFSNVLTFSLIVQLVLGMVLFIISSRALHIVDQYFKLLIGSYREDIDTTDIIDWGQEYFKCCGAGEYTDWEHNIYFNCSSISYEACSVPYSCCVIHDNDSTVLNTFCGFGVLKQQPIELDGVIHTTGCIHALTEWLHQHLFLLAALGIAMVVPQIVG